MFSPYCTLRKTESNWLLIATRFPGLKTKELLEIPETYSSTKLCLLNINNCIRREFLQEKLLRQNGSPEAIQINNMLKQTSKQTNLYSYLGSLLQHSFMNDL